MKSPTYLHFDVSSYQLLAGNLDNIKPGRRIHLQFYLNIIYVELVICTFKMIMYTVALLTHI